MEITNCEGGGGGMEKLVGTELAAENDAIRQPLMTDLDEKTLQHDSWLQKVGLKKTLGDVVPQGEKVDRTGAPVRAGATLPL